MSDANARSDETQTPKPPRRRLGRAIAIGAAAGAAIGIAVAFVLVFVLGPVEPDGRLGSRAILGLSYEAGFAGAIIGGIVGAVMSKLRNAP